MSEFIKVDNRILVKPNGFDYDLINGKVYNLKYDRYEGRSYIEEDGTLNLPDKVYLIDEDKSFIERVNYYYNNTTKLSTGVMLEGIKGTGKTVMAKIIAKEANLPILVVDNNYPTNAINDFFTKFKTPVTVIFDEVDKNWDTENLLSWLDGVQSNAKKLVLFTCNKINNTSEYLKNRCSRVRYYKHFEPNDNARFLKSIIKDKEISDIDETYKFIIDTFKLLSIDNINSFLDEKKLFSNLSNEKILREMNIESKIQDDSVDNIECDKSDDNDNDFFQSFDNDESNNEESSYYSIA